jgi:hypothetical protein
LAKILNTIDTERWDLGEEFKVWEETKATPRHRAFSVVFSKSSRFYF